MHLEKGLRTYVQTVRHSCLVVKLLSYQHHPRNELDKYCSTSRKSNIATSILTQVVHASMCTSAHVYVCIRAIVYCMGSKLIKQGSSNRVTCEILTDKRVSLTDVQHNHYGLYSYMVHTVYVLLQPNSNFKV